jgi:hypothetical protein
MDTSFIQKNLNIDESRILVILQIGGTRYDLFDYHKDIDYLVILDKKFSTRRYYDDINKIDYICFGIDHFKKILEPDAHMSGAKFFALLDLSNQAQ